MEGTEQEKAEARERIQMEMAMQQQNNIMSQQTAKVEQMIAKNVLSSLQLVEEKMDADMQKLDDIENLTESQLDAYRDRRKEQMKKLAAQREEWKAQGHGEYIEIRGPKEFFSECKRSERVVVHFFRASTARCAIVDRHLSDISKKHLETRFFKVDAEKSPFLVERLHITMMPSILIIKNSKTEHTIRGFDEFGGVDDFSTAMVEYVLGLHHAINHDGRPPEAVNSNVTHVSRL